MAYVQPVRTGDQNLRTIRVGDLVFYEDPHYGHHRFWLVEGIHLGATGQESLIELHSLSEQPGKVGKEDFVVQTVTTTLVPEALLRALPLYRPVA